MLTILQSKQRQSLSPRRRRRRFWLKRRLRPPPLPRSSLKLERTTGLCGPLLGTDQTYGDVKKVNVQTEKADTSESQEDLLRNERERLEQRRRFLSSSKQ